MKICQLSFNDIETVRPLWTLLNSMHFHHSNNWKSHFKNLTFQKRIEVLQRADEVTIFIIKQESEIIGYCIASIKAKVGEIDSLFIREGNRGHGFGEILMTRCNQWFEERGIKELNVEVAEGNETALPFYEKLGFKKYMTILKKKE